MEITNPTALRLIEERRKEKEDKKEKYKAQQKERSRKWLEANREKNKETSRLWRIANLELAREKDRRYQKENREQCRERQRKWREANSERFIETNRKYREANRDRLNAYYCQRNYNITIEERDALFIKQGSCCACCEATEPGKRGWHVDHCHITGIVRGILCSNCNLALGHVKDNIQTLEKMITYLKQYSTGEQHANGHSHSRPSFNTASP